MNNKVIEFENSKGLREFSTFIDKTKDNKNNIFKIYKKNIFLSRSKSIYYEKQSIILNKIYSLYNNKTLRSLINDIINTNPFKNSNQIRNEYRSDRNTKDYEKQLKGCFRIKELERDIEANLFNNDIYDLIGTTLAYELPLNKTKNQLPIDLVSYKHNEDGDYIYLIELKRCNSNDKASNQNNEMFIRAFLEITTYYSHFIHILEDDKKKDYLLSELESNANNKGITFNKKFKIKRVILAPKSFYENIHEDIKKELQDYLLLSIERKDGIDLTKEIVGANKQLFNIEKVNIDDYK